MLVSFCIGKDAVCSSRVLVHHLFNLQPASATVILQIQMHCIQQLQWKLSRKP